MSGSDESTGTVEISPEIFTTGKPFVPAEMTSSGLMTMPCPALFFTSVFANILQAESLNQARKSGVQSSSVHTSTRLQLNSEFTKFGHL